MTCIVGLRHGGVVHMGGDDAITGELVHTNGSKVVMFPSGLLVGFAGSLTTQRVMSSDEWLSTLPGIALPALRDLDSDREVHALFQRLFSVGGSQVRGVKNESFFWAELLLAMGPTLVYAGNVGGWYRIKDEFRVIGDGSLVATGAMHVLEDVEPRERIRRSIDAASKYVAGVGKMSDYQMTSATVAPSPPSPLEPDAK